MIDDLKSIINIFLITLLIALTVYGAMWSTDVTMEHQKVINISTKYHIPESDYSAFPMRGRDVVFDGDNVIYFISKNDYDKCNVGDIVSISYTTMYIPFIMGNASAGRLAGV
jgi:hypothetical protein